MLQHTCSPLGGGGGGCIALHAPAFELLFNLLQVILADDMGGNDQLPLRMLLKITDENIFIGGPRRTSNKHLGSLADKLLYYRQLLRLLLNLQHAVEAGIAHHGHLSDAYLGQSSSRLCSFCTKKWVKHCSTRL